MDLETKTETTEPKVDEVLDEKQDSTEEKPEQTDKPEVPEKPEVDPDLIKQLVAEQLKAEREALEAEKAEKDAEKKAAQEEEKRLKELTKEQLEAEFKKAREAEKQLKELQEQLARAEAEKQAARIEQEKLKLLSAHSLSDEALPFVQGTTADELATNVNSFKQLIEKEVTKRLEAEKVKSLEGKVPGVSQRASVAKPDSAQKLKGLSYSERLQFENN